MRKYPSVDPLFWLKLSISDYKVVEVVYEGRMIKADLMTANGTVKNRLKKTVSVIVGLCLLIRGECFAVESSSTQLPVELDLKIISNLPAIDILSLAQVNHAWRAVVQKFVMSESDLLDLSPIESNQAQFSNLVREGGILHLAKNIVLSHLNYRGDWIGFLPTEILTPRENGRARLKVKTTTGAVFSYMGQQDELGHGWRDPNSLIWFGPARINGSGQLLRMTHLDAIQYCSARGARLPSSEEWKTLSQFFGRNDEINDQGSRYAAQVLSNLEVWYWALPIEGDDPAKAPVFNGVNGGIFNTNRNLDKAVRCVLPAV
ncbi:MAG: F-box protein [Bdellovibrionia bacterium]